MRRVLVFLLAMMPAIAAAQQDALPDSLTGRPGDPGRGREIVLNRTVGLCVLCHGLQTPDAVAMGDLAPSLNGVGSRATVGQLRLRMVDAARLNPDTIMPPYYRTDRLNRVARNFQGKTILSAEQIEDVVAYLATLKE